MDHSEKDPGKPIDTITSSCIVNMYYTIWSCHDPLPVGSFPVVGEYRNLQEGEDMAEPHNNK